MTEATPAPPPKPGVRQWAARGAVALLFVLTVFLAVAYFRRAPAEVATTRFLVSTPTTPSPNDIAISPDGRRLAFVAAVAGSGAPLLWVRSLDSVVAQPLPGTEGAAQQPFWSPDSRFLGFYSQGKLKKIEVPGGPVEILCDAGGGAQGGTWNRDGIILFGGSGGLQRVSAAGGKVTLVTSLDRLRQEFYHRWPQFLPDGRHFLYWILSTEPAQQGIYVGSLDSKESKRLLAADSMAIYAPPGYLLFIRAGNLMAQAFDAGRIELSGEAFPLAQAVGYNLANRQGGFAASSNGVLVYRNSSGSQQNRQLTWFDRGGKPLGTIGVLGSYLNPKLSPDGKRIAVELTGPAGSSDIWLLEIARGISTRFTFDPAPDKDPLWSPDGSRIAFSSSRQGTNRLYQKLSSGAGTEESLLQSSGPTSPYDWSADGRFIVYVVPGGDTDLWVLPLVGDPRQAGTEGRKPFPFIETVQFQETHAQISPDGNWLAYVSTESGRDEIFVQSFPKPGSKWQVSTNGGVQPRWRRDGKELFYIALDRKLMAVPVRGESALEFGSPTALFETRTFQGVGRAPFFRQQYDLTPDGQRFLMNVPVGEESAALQPITVVLNWAEELKRRVPAGR